MDSITDKRKGEFAKLIGDAYYMKNDYPSAVNYYKIFKKNAKNLGKVVPKSPQMLPKSIQNQ